MLVIVLLLDQWAHSKWEEAQPLHSQLKGVSRLTGIFQRAADRKTNSQTFKTFFPRQVSVCALQIALHFMATYQAKVSTEKEASKTVIWYLG